MNQTAWTIEKEFTFEAAHRLPFHEGKCARLHGHSYKCTVCVDSEELIDSGSESGMVMDFGRVKDSMKPLLNGYLDHYYLNESLKMVNPTAEAIAQWIYRRLRVEGLPVSAVRIAETCTCSVIYSEKNQ